MFWTLVLQPLCSNGGLTSEMSVSLHSSGGTIIVPQFRNCFLRNTYAVYTSFYSLIFGICNALLKYIDIDAIENTFCYYYYYHHFFRHLYRISCQRSQMSWITLLLHQMEQNL